MVYECFLWKWQHKFDKKNLCERDDLTFKSHIVCCFHVLLPTGASHEKVIFFPFFIHVFLSLCYVFLCAHCFFDRSVYSFTL